jgi:hypothetical protein
MSKACARAPANATKQLKSGTVSCCPHPSLLLLAGALSLIFSAAVVGFCFCALGLLGGSGFALHLALGICR